jgi:hypothetical protein
LGGESPGFRRFKGKEGSASFLKKRSKKLYYAGSWALALTQPQAQHNKSFLRRFFSKKRLLSSLA